MQPVHITEHQVCKNKGYENPIWKYNYFNQKIGPSHIKIHKKTEKPPVKLKCINCESFYFAGGDVKNRKYCSTECSKEYAKKEREEKNRAKKNLHKLFIFKIKLTLNKSWINYKI